MNDKTILNDAQYLWNETRAFYERFDIMPPDVTAAKKKLREEHSEFQQAAAHLWHIRQGNAGNVFDATSDVAQEAADTIVTVFGVLMALGLDYCDLADALHHVAEKNAAKIPDVTHVLVDGLITRKDRV